MLPIPRKYPITYPIEPDRELLAWERWITIRKEEADKLSKSTRRPPVDLVMNLQQHIRADKERKIILEEAKIETKFKIRGHLWEDTPSLKQGCPCEPVYEAHVTLAEMGRPRKIVHVGIPTEIKVKEMGYDGVRERVKCNLLDAKYHQYRDKREKDLKEKILKIDPYRSEIDKLMVRGINPPPPPRKMPRLPVITESLVNQTTCENPYEVYALRINNSLFFKSNPEHDMSALKKMQKEQWHENCTSWSYYFNVPVNKAGRGKLYLQNLGTVTIRYCWKQIKKVIPFIPEENEQMFFFNKNEDVLAPGQEKLLYFTFVSDKPGVYKERWQLSLSNVSFFDILTDKLVINLSADAIEDYITTNTAIKQLKSDIYMQSIINDVSELIADVISKATAVQPTEYPYKKYFLEAELFVMKNPVCSYHQTEVMKMKDLYAEMSNNDGWDLSIGSWREIMLTKEYDERMKYYDLLKKAHRELLKPWYEGEDLLKAKHRAVRLLLAQLAKQFDLEHDRLVFLYSSEETGDNSPASPASSASGKKVNIRNPKEVRVIATQNVFFLQMYEHVGNTIETCAGILESLDLNRWIEFDFCRH